MAEVDVLIGDRSFRLACDDGQETRLKTLAADFNARVAGIRRQGEGIGETQAILVAALAVLDEYDEALSRWSRMTPEGAAEEWAAAKLDAVSERLERALDKLDD